MKTQNNWRKHTLNYNQSSAMQVSGDAEGDVPEEELEGEDQEAEEDQEIEYSEAERAILEASEEYYSEEGLSEETYNQLAQFDSQELLDTYLALQEQQQEAPAADLI